MQTITTKFFRATNTKPARIEAITSSGLCIWHSTTNDDDSGHAAAARALMVELGWTGEMVGGALGNQGNQVWVFTQGDKIQVWKEEAK